MSASSGANQSGSNNQRSVKQAKRDTQKAKAAVSKEQMEATLAEQANRIKELEELMKKQIDATQTKHSAWWDTSEDSYWQQASWWSNWSQEPENKMAREQWSSDQWQDGNQWGESGEADAVLWEVPERCVTIQGIAKETKQLMRKWI